MGQLFQFGYEVRKEFQAIYQKIQLILSTDSSDAKTNLVDAISTYTDKFQPDLYDLEFLETAVHTYQKQLASKNKIALYTAAEEILSSIKSIQRSVKLGYFNTNSNNAKDHLFGASFENILSDINDSDYSSNTNIAEVFNNILKRLDSDQDSTLQKILLDVYASEQTKEEIQNNIANYETNYGNKIDQHLVTSSIYSALTNGASITDIPTILSILDKFDSYLSDPNKNFSTFKSLFFENNSIALIQTAASDVNSHGRAAQNLALSILSILDPDGIIQDMTIFNDLTLDILYSNKDGYDIISSIANLVQSDYPDQYSLIAALYSTFNYGSGSATRGASDYLNKLNPSNSEPQLKQPLADLIEYVKTNSFSSYADLASTIGNLASNIDQNTIRELEMDMAATGFPASLIANNFEYVGADINDFITNKYNNFGLKLYGLDVLGKYVNDIYTAFNLGNYYKDLASAIDTVENLNNFVSSVKNLQSKNYINNYHLLSENIASLITPYSSELSSKLEADITTAGLKIDDIKFYLQDIYGNTPSQLAAAMYYAWGGGIFQQC